MKSASKLLLGILVLLSPILLVTTSIRVALTPIFVNAEYQLPGFPEDEYGFSTNDRLTWSRYAINYLLGHITHDELSNQVLPEGTPLFNERELSHMLDVRYLTTIVLRVWYGLMIFFIIIAVIYWRSNKKIEYLNAIQQGGWLTIALILSILIYLAINFNQLFTRFHQIFFQGDSWLFYLSDNLIRLFPMRFWRDIFIFIGGLSILSGFVFIAAKSFLPNQFTGKINS